MNLNNTHQEGWLAKHAVNEQDKLAAEQKGNNGDGEQKNPMQALEDLDIAGPKPSS